MGAMTQIGSDAGGSGGKLVGLATREAEVELKLELLMDNKDEGLQTRELCQVGQQFPHVVFRDLPAQDGVADASIDAVRRPEGQLVDIVLYQRDLAHEVQRPVEALDEQVRLQEEDVARQVDIFGGRAQGQGLVVVKDEVSRLAADGGEGWRWLRVDVGEHQSFPGRGLELCVGGVEHLVYSGLRERVVPYHGPYLSGEFVEEGESF